MYVKSETSPDAPTTVYFPTGCVGRGRGLFVSVSEQKVRDQATRERTLMRSTDL